MMNWPNCKSFAYESNSLIIIASINVYKNLNHNHHHHHHHHSLPTAWIPSILSVSVCFYHTHTLSPHPYWLSILWSPLDVSIRNWWIQVFAGWATLVWPCVGVHVLEYSLIYIEYSLIYIYIYIIHSIILNLFHQLHKVADSSEGDFYRKRNSF